ncbi:unnamed protein product [Nippostrongylus brasiliensis]|uniref:28S ribosomal protein S6, mitochondrial n=1 Tax=Nippostrongylus brasiliensis TaxID=27835 RepID=A0A0N4XZE7_NIPBR|nr:unnamed protein product [Nippostrongylus brasiliensis]
MPAYEVSLITRSLSKADLIKTLVRAGKTLLDHGAVIEKVESLGFRDLPFKRIAKQTHEPVYTSNFFIFHTHMPTGASKTTKSIFMNDLDTVRLRFFLICQLISLPFLQVHVAVVPCVKPEPIECNLEEILKPPAHRQAVKDLREGQKMGHFTRQMIYKRTEKEWKSIPKSYPIAPQRP